MLTTEMIVDTAPKCVVLLRRQHSRRSLGQS
jgi:hypothetical protein